LTLFTAFGGNGDVVASIELFKDKSLLRAYIPPAPRFPFTRRRPSLVSLIVETRAGIGVTIAFSWSWP
jgi:hypothetical protein